MLELPLTTNLKIENIGGLGDGIAHFDKYKIMIPYTCQGEEILAQITSCDNNNLCQATLKSIVQPSHSRALALCSHYTDCGGCNLQHLAVHDYKNFKQQILINALQICGANLDAIVEPIKIIGKKTRRRIELKLAINNTGKLKIGFFAPRSNNVVDINFCHVASIGIMDLVLCLKIWLHANINIARNIIALQITEVSNGFDLLIKSRKINIKFDHEDLKNFALKNKILRISKKLEDNAATLLYQNAEPIIEHLDCQVKLPLEYFVQASKEAADFIATKIMIKLQNNKVIADLFCGSGSYTLPLAKQGKTIYAYELSTDMIAALHNAAKNSNLSNVQAFCRDLNAKPLDKGQLEQFDAVIINPPRGGASPQCKILALNNNIKDIIMVSCSAASFARDAKTLIRGGYKIDSVMAIDQFYWSNHLEILAHFKR